MPADGGYGRCFESVLLTEGYEVAPEDVGNLDGDKGHPVSLLQLFKVVDKRAEGFLVVRMDFGLCFGADTDYFHEGAILEVEDEWIAERLLQIGAEIRLRLDWCCDR